MAEGSGVNQTQIWVAVITVVGGVLTAIVVNADKWIMRGDRAAVAAPAAAAPADASAPPVAAPASQMANVVGEWRDDDGSHFTFTQTGSSYQYTHTASNGTLQSVGKGTISGRDLTHTFETPAGDTGTCTARVNAAANRITGSCRNQDGGWTFVIER